MTHRVLRRNRRKGKANPIPKGPIFLLAISLVIFVGGIGNLAWAVNAHSNSPGTSSQSSGKPHSTQSALSPYNGLIGQERIPCENAQSAPSANAADTLSPQEHPPEPELASEEEESASFSLQPEAGNASASTPAYSTANDSGAAERESYVIHHDAYSETPVYRTVHHQASTLREVTSGGFTRLEWTTCPVCGQRHDSAFNERIVDHINEIYCSACGEKHAESYDEVLYY